MKGKLEMITATAHLKSTSPYSQSKHYSDPKLDREIPRDYEARTWRSRMHVTKDGFVFIPPMAFKNCLSEAAKFWNKQIPGKGKATYTKHFEAGIILLDEVQLSIRAEDVEGEWLFLPSDGQRGGGKRVDKCYPRIDAWSAVVAFQILDEIITEDVFSEVLEVAGSYIGIGRWRPRNNGCYGRFTVESLKWSSRK
jgi:hypothetical protein